MSKDLIINEQIRANIVTLILANGDNKGQFTKAAAIQMARNDGMDLIQVAPGNPPICRIADYGKLRYKATKAEKKHDGPKLKEIKFGIKIADHDLDVKLRKIEELTQKGHKVMVVAELEGREKYGINFKEMGRTKLKSVTDHFATTLAFTPFSEADGKKFTIRTTLSPK